MNDNIQANDDEFMKLWYKSTFNLKKQLVGERLAISKKIDSIKHANNLYTSSMAEIGYLLQSTSLDKKILKARYTELEGLKNQLSTELPTLEVKDNILYGRIIEIDRQLTDVSAIANKLQIELQQKAKNAIKQKLIDKENADKINAKVKKINSDVAKHKQEGLCTYVYTSIENTAGVKMTENRVCMKKAVKGKDFCRQHKKELGL